MAAPAGWQPKVHGALMGATVKYLWKLLDVGYDRFSRSADGYHIKTC